MVIVISTEHTEGDTMKKITPRIFTTVVLLLTAVSLIIRALGAVLFYDFQSEAYTGPNILLYVLGVLLLLTVPVIVVLARNAFLGRKSLIVPKSNFITSFVTAMAGFLFVIAALVMAYCRFTGIADSYTGSTPLADVLLILSSLDIAAFMFRRIGKNFEEKRRKSTYGLNYVLPVEYAITRLFVLFYSCLRRVTLIYEKLTLVSLVVICLFFLYEARYANSEKKRPLAPYCSMAGLAVLFVTLSALPSLVVFLIYPHGIMNAVFCVADLSIAAYAAVNLFGVANDKRD